MGKKFPPKENFSSLSYQQDQREHLPIKFLLKSFLVSIEINNKPRSCAQLSGYKDNGKREPGISYLIEKWRLINKYSSVIIKASNGYDCSLKEKHLTHEIRKPYADSHEDLTLSEGVHKACPNR